MTMRQLLGLATAFVLGGGALAPVVIGAAEDSSPAGVYTAALARERALREPGEAPTLNDYRAAIAAYGAIERRFPDSRFNDHALWQAAGLALEAYDRYRDEQDHREGVRMLRALAERHPDSPFAERVPERLREIGRLGELVWLSEIQHATFDDLFRVTIQLDREVRFHSEELANPSRLFFDFPQTEAAASLRNATLTVGGEDAVIRAIRLGRHPNHVTRVVLDTSDTASCNTFTLYEPYRLVVDCRPSIEARASAAPLPVPQLWSIAPMSPVLTDPPSVHQGWTVGGLVAEVARPRFEATPPPAATLPDPVELPRLWAATHTLAAPLLSPSPTGEMPAFPVPRPALDTTPLPPEFPFPTETSAGDLSLARQLGLRVSRIVIDPGHGGHDPGARARGLDEAALVLDIAHRLQKRLTEQLGLEVVMTRRGDDTMPLEARTTLANRVEGDLFLSIHANASRRAEARGVETYFLDLATDHDAATVAARENVGGIRKMADIEDLVQTIATNNKLDESRDFAEHVHQALLDGLRAVDPEIPDLGVKHAPFIVLINARMPSILAEISFLTNRQDATLLSTDDYRDRIADALFRGIISYQQSLNATRLVAQVDQD